MKTMKKRRNFYVLYAIYYALRQRYQLLFRKDYVESQLETRKGSCLEECEGLCCRINVPWCEHLEDGKCTIYKKQPFHCKIFPIDERQKELADVKEECTYYWDNIGM